MQKTIAMIFAAGRVEELAVLTERRAKAAVIFAGSYRTIDFALTNLANAGIGRVGILAQYRPASLVNHVGIGMAWDLVGTDRAVRFLSPYIGPDRGEFYRGPADALYQNIDFIEKNQPEDVLIVSGDHVCNMDYTTFLSFHKERAADVSMAFKPVSEQPSRFGIGELNSVGQIVNFTEKPEYPRTNLASIGVYLFKRQVLVDELLRAASGKDEVSTVQFHEIIRRLIPRRSAYGYTFNGEWYYTRTLDEYYEFHQNLLGPSPKVNLNEWKIRSNTLLKLPAPTRCLPQASVKNSLVSEGCEIAGTVRNSVLSPGVKVEKGAVVSNSVLWDDVIVKEGAVLDKVISDKRAVFGAASVVGDGKTSPCKEMPRSLTCGATVVGMEVRIPAKATIGRNCIIHPEAGEECFKKPVGPGESIFPRKAGK
ncbi:MAG TPA: sugar phosphate nucleotidyltransferase [Chitinivibrionales bacterium]|nr:sugar phosphate nucleotidyltransferase [Chitinivibrionales bacterium]